MHRIRLVEVACELLESDRPKEKEWFLEVNWFTIVNTLVGRILNTNEIVHQQHSDKKDITVEQYGTTIIWDDNIVQETWEDRHSE